MPRPRARARAAKAWRQVKKTVQEGTAELQDNGLQPPQLAVTAGQKETYAWMRRGIARCMANKVDGPLTPLLG